jgi:carbon-monoxide dehydrogenase large subunit
VNNPGEDTAHAPGTATGQSSGVLGTSVRRKEDHRLVTGRGRYVSDLELPRMRHVAFLRSPYGHARITGVDTAAAREAGYRVFIGADFAHIALRAQSALPSYVETDQPIIAHEKVCFAGEPVAAVVAGDRYEAEDGMELVEVDYEPLPVTVCAWEDPAEPVHPEAPDNVLLQRTFDAGAVTDTLAAADLVVERELVTNRHAGQPMECRWLCGTPGTRN